MPSKQLWDELAFSGRFSGSVLVAADGKTLIDDAWGDADREQKVANKPETSYDVGSIGKLFTQIAILQLVEAGKLKLDDTIGKYLTDYPTQDVAAKVTIRQLLLQSSGMTDVFDRITSDINPKSLPQSPRPIIPSTKSRAGVTSSTSLKLR